MKRIFYIIFLLLFLGSCTSRTIYKKPENLIDKEQMIQIWTDIYIATAARSQKTIALEKDKNYMPMVLKNHKIDSVQFSESNIYYTSRIDEYEKMFEEVQKRLKELKEPYDPETELDSILRRNREQIDDYQ
ncbi:MAG: DUF4296 domain-containing protein [Flavobacteriaceae bacterium]|nr:DUF4296 domain-containing protein [Flavobacteriaceae bacterium]